MQGIVNIEAECFPAAEAATEASLSGRLAFYPNHFWVQLDGDRMIGFVNGMVTDEPDLRDEMYEDASLHNENGAWQMIFGVDTIPEYRCRGCGTLLRQVWFCERGRFRFYPRKCGLVSDEAKFLIFMADQKIAATVTAVLTSTDSITPRIDLREVFNAVVWG